jgi:hypothetical protein
MQPAHVQPANGERDETKGGSHGDIPAYNCARHFDFSVRYRPRWNRLGAPLEKSGLAARKD